MGIPKILLDSGHGGNDPGAVYDGLYEKDIVLPLVYHVASHLHRVYNGKVLCKFTRETDCYKTIKHRVGKEHAIQPDLFVSLHVNSSSTPHTASGVEVLYYSKKGREVGDVLIDELSCAPFSMHGDGLVHRPGLGVLRKTNAVAILIECLFINSNCDRDILTDPERLDTLAESIATGIKNSQELWYWRG